MNWETRMTKDIARLKDRLINECESSGIYENFGQREVRALRDKYGEDYTWQRKTRPIDVFDDWCMNFTGK